MKTTMISLLAGASMLLGVSVLAAQVNFCDNSDCQFGVEFVNNTPNSANVFFGEYGSDNNTWNIIGNNNSISFNVPAYSEVWSANTTPNCIPINFFDYNSSRGGYTGYVNFGVSINGDELNPPPVYLSDYYYFDGFDHWLDLYADFYNQDKKTDALEIGNYNITLEGLDSRFSYTAEIDGFSYAVNPVLKVVLNETGTTKQSITVVQGRPSPIPQYPEFQ